ncbi:leucyl aminopeptidase [Methylophilus medardicus]|uniref:Probable cytosol aminopeptidase n=1 Tax=Methylophilus medardicus TaxID=2588534 RepID=A0A5B8CPW5_9PROT|nr:leucyl aminopeptidase [Methylophilus medardicus]QDC43282.1 leucyl aminopeptidase [Methylophilus medardicus]QDC48289.1 leucyl aminopeptidase [Methylophilus medardicus]QDC51994.1 leucyl aminopeptidase [Methylophilus medardicus]
MEFSIKSTAPEKLRTDCLLVGIYEGRKLTDLAKSLDTLSEKAISTALKSGDMEGKAGTTLLLRQLAGVSVPRILLVGLGKAEELTLKQLKSSVRAAVKALPAGVESIAADFASLSIKKSSVQQIAAALAEVVLDATYKVNAVKQKSVEPHALKQVILLVDKADQAAAELGASQGRSLGQGVALAKDLGNLPPNICTPTYLGKQAEKLAKDYGFKVEVLDQAAIEKLNMGSFLGVTQGSDEPPRFIVLQHLHGKKTQKPVVLVGKGITFDTGGISLKPGADMDEMKYDMCGAASVLGVFKALGELKLPLNVVGLIPTCENMPSGRATKPGDVLTSMSGQTIEVLNTDAEGRLILCDALTYAERFEPAAVIDIATLTGACVIALGHHVSGLFANNDSLAKALLDAGEKAGDRAWQMPMLDEYQGQLDSNFADIANIGGRAAGSITAACFLSRFAKKYDWAHLDIAGTAWKSGKEKGGTGRPVPLLVTYLMQQAAK